MERNNPAKDYPSDFDVLIVRIRVLLKIIASFCQFLKKSISAMFYPIRSKSRELRRSVIGISFQIEENESVPGLKALKNHPSVRRVTTQQIVQRTILLDPDEEDKINGTIGTNFRRININQVS